MNSDTLSASLHDFRSKMSDSISRILSEPAGPGSGFLSLTGLQKCFELTSATNRAFAKLMEEIDYPMSRWGGKDVKEYLNYSLNMLDLLNLITSSVSHLSQARVSISHALSVIRNSPTSSPAKNLQKIPRKKFGESFKFEGSIRIEERPGSDKEFAVLQALMVSRKVEFLALGLVLSGLCGDAKPYMDIRKSEAGGFEDPLIRELDLRLCKQVAEIHQGIMEEVKGVNIASEDLSAVISTGRYSEAVEELKRRLEVLENSIQGIEKQTNNLFSEILSTRNKLLDNIRLSTRQNPGAYCSFFSRT